MTRLGRAGWALVLVAMMASCGRPVDDPTGEVEPLGTADPAGAVTRSVSLFFPGTDGRLHAEAREVPVGERREDAILGVVRAVVDGPRGEQLYAPLPAVRAVLAAAAAEQAADAKDDPDGEGEATDDPAANAEAEAAELPRGPLPAIEVYWIDETVYVDLPQPTSPIAVGAHEELLMLYSLVNSVLLNTPEASRLVVLWNGRQPQTFAGHIDTGRPLAARQSLLAEPMS